MNRRIVLPPEPEPKVPTVMERILAVENRRKQGNWYPACGGTEVPFYTRLKRRLLYCFQPSSGDHAYLDLDQDRILSDKEAEEAFGGW
jgi:hypothetical protein